MPRPTGTWESRCPTATQSSGSRTAIARAHAATIAAPPNRNAQSRQSGDAQCRRALSDICQPAFGRRIAHQLGARPEAEFLDATGLVGLRRLDADVEPARNLLVGESERDQLQDLGLPRR